MVNSSRVFHLTRYLLASFILLYLLFPYLRSHSPEYVRDHYAEILRSFQDEKKLFVAEYLQNEVGREMDGSALASLCASKTWFPVSQYSVILSCEPVPGGIGEVKNGQLNCIRFAIEIGAQLILPRMRERSAGDIANLQGGQTTKGLSLDYMFSTPHLVNLLRTHCPQMQVHDSLDALYDKPSLLKPISFTLDLLTTAYLTVDGNPTTILAAPEQLRAQFRAFMDRELPPLEKRHYPVRAHLGNTLFAWRTLNETAASGGGGGGGGSAAAAASSTGFRADFGKLLRVRDDIRALAASALWNLAKAHAVTLPDPRTGFSSSSSNNHNDNDNVGAASEGFVGVHLRTEKDAREAGGSWPPYDDQVAYHFNFLLKHAGGPRRVVVFLATGLTARDDDVRRFRARAAELNATVVVKRDLLDEEEVRVLNGLSWDQRALVDYEILLRAETVLGIVESSFAWDIALRRGLAYGTGEREGFVMGAAAARPGGGEVLPVGSGVYEKTEMAMWRDRWSTLFGKADRAVGMYLGMWP